MGFAGMTVKTKLVLSFGVLILLLAVVASIGIRGASSINDMLNTIVDNSSTKVKLAERMSQDLLQIGRLEKNLILAEDPGKMREILDDAGFDISGDSPPEVVVAGIKFDLSYDDLKQAALHIRDGAAFVGTNPDKTFPSPEGQVPGAGSLIAALEAATDQSATIIGKPAEPMFKNALELLGTEAANTLMVGDRLNTDILGGQQAGMKTALVFTGVTSSDALSQADNDLWPDVAYEGLPELIKAWAGFEWYNAKQKAKRGRA